MVLRNVDGRIQDDVGEIFTANLPWPARIEDCGPGDARRHPPIKVDARKGDRGRLLIVGGGPYHGAPSSPAWLQKADGLVPLGHAIRSGRTCRMALVLDSRRHSRHHSHHDAFGCGDFDRVLNGRVCQAVLIGPGLGRESESIEAVCDLIEKLVEANIPLVIDADAIRALLPTNGLQEWSEWSPLIKKRWPIGWGHPILLRFSTFERDAMASSVWLRTNLASSSVQELEDELWAPGGRHCFASGGHARMSVGGTGIC